LLQWQQIRVQAQQLLAGADFRPLAHFAGFDRIGSDGLQALALGQLQLAVLQVQAIQHSGHQQAVGDGALPGVEQLNRAQREACERTMATTKAAGLLGQVLLQRFDDFAGIKAQAIGQLVDDGAQERRFRQPITPGFLKRFNHGGAHPRIESQLTHGQIEAFAAFTQAVTQLLQLHLGIAGVELASQATPLAAREALAQGGDRCAEAGHGGTNAAQCCLDS